MSVFSGIVAQSSGNTPPVSGWTATLTFPSDSPYVSAGFVSANTPYIYTLSGASQQTGNYPGPSFAQESWLATNASCPIQVYFRPDTAGGRMEVLFENVKCGLPSGSGTNPQDIYPGSSSGITYSVLIQNSGVTQYSENATFVHSWAGRWRWQSAARPIINTPTTIMNNKWWYQMTSSGTPVPYANFVPSSGATNWDPGVGGGYGPCTYPSPLSYGGLNLQFGATGDTFQIGGTAEPSAQWLINPNGTGSNTGQTYVSGMLAFAEAIAGCPINFRDETTGAPINFRTYPSVNTYGTSGNGYGPFVKGQAWLSVNQPGWANPWGPDVAHWPNTSFIAFLATFDPRFLEDLQFAALYTFMESAYYNGGYGSGTGPFVQPIQVREVAWGWRNLLCAYYATYLAEQNGAMPSWILPSSVFLAAINDNISFYNTNWVQNTTVINGQTPPTENFSCVARCGSSEFWEQDFVTLAWGLGQLWGVSGMSSMVNWAAGNTLGRIAGAGSNPWPPAYCSPYYINQDKQGQAVVPTPAQISSFPGDSFNTTWGGTGNLSLWQQFVDENLMSFTGSISGSVLTISSIQSQTATAALGVGNTGFPCTLYGAGVAAGQTIISQISGSTGSTGTYQLSAYQSTVSNEAMQANTVGGSGGFPYITPAILAALAADKTNGGVWIQSIGGDFLLYAGSAVRALNQLGYSVSTPQTNANNFIANKGYMTGRQAYST